MPLILLILIACGLAYGIWRWRQYRRQKVLMSMSLSDQQRMIIADCVPLCRKLPKQLQDSFEGKVNRFLHQVKFFGCDGLIVTDKMRLVIAAQACLLIVNRNVWYEHLHTVLIYPGAFKARVEEEAGYVVTERDSVRIGESWERGPVILSWADTEEGAFIDDDGHNVVLHEFTHQLDSLSGETDGTPILAKGHRIEEWAEALQEAYDRLIKDVEAGRDTILDPYGTESPQEFLAVAVETFFEQSAISKQEEPQVYEQLSEFFKLDPANW